MKREFRLTKSTFGDENPFPTQGKVAGGRKGFLLTAST